MELQKIEIVNLFGIFKHEINIKKDGITIIIGENGLGKTILLESVLAFFNGKYTYLYSLDFEELNFTFSDKSKWRIQKDYDEKDNIEILSVSLMKGKNVLESFYLKNYNERELYEVASRVARNIRGLRKVSPRKWINENTNEIYSTDEVIAYAEEHHRDYLNDLFNNFVSQDDEKSLFSFNIPSWFSEHINTVKVSLIETQRLISLNNSYRENTLEKNVLKYSKELTKIISTSLTKSTELSSELDRTYPNRLINRINQSKSVNYEKLMSNLEELEYKRSLLDKVGLIAIEKDSNIINIENINKREDLGVVKEVLMLYVEDSFKKIEIFDELSQKIKLFLDIINKRFKHKQLFINKESGFLLKSTKIKDENGEFKNIPVTKLSSGEQNELVLFYLLLFQTEKNSMILIDEPEVSLHISWQNNFINDLKQIRELNNLEVIIATHSPDIINGNWDLTERLVGIE